MSVTITKPGIYTDLSSEDYHAQTDWLGASQLKGFIPEFYSQPTGRDALDFGSALHTRVLGTDERIDVHHFATWRSKAAETAREESWAAGAIPILGTDSELINGMVKALHNHEKAAQLLWQAPGRNEVSIFAEDHEGRQFKCRPDRLLNNGAIVDLKSTREKPGRYNLARVVVNLGYDLAAAHYTEVGALADIDVTGFGFVFVSKQPPHLVSIVELGDDLLGDGYALRHLALTRAAQESPPYEGAGGLLTLNRPFRRDIPA